MSSESANCAAPDRYPFSPGPITKLQAIKWIASILYPGEPPRAAENRVRERIRRGGLDGKLDQSREIDPPTFFDWAVEQRGWSGLREVVGLPRNPNVGSADLVLPMVIMSGTGYSTPSDPDELRAAHAECQQERLRLRQQLSTISSEVEQLRVEVSKWREKNERMRAKNSESGKKSKGARRSR